MKKNNFEEASICYNNGILRVEYHVGVVIDSDILLKQISARKNMTGNDNFFMLIDLSKAKDITEDALIFAAENPASENVKAIAVITKDGLCHLRAKLYAIFDNPNITTKAFTCAIDGIEWFALLEKSIRNKAA